MPGIPDLGQDPEPDQSRLDRSSRASLRLPDNLRIQPIEILAKQLFEIALAHTALGERVPDRLHAARAIELLEIERPVLAFEVGAFLSPEFIQVFLVQDEASVVAVRADADALKAPLGYHDADHAEGKPAINATDTAKP